MIQRTKVAAPNVTKHVKVVLVRRLTNALHATMISIYSNIVAYLNAKKIVIPASLHMGIVNNALKAIIYISSPV
jgi:hypothetical protein